MTIKTDSCTKKTATAFIFLLVLLIISLAFSLLVGSSFIAPHKAFVGLFDESASSHIIMRYIRLPRTLAALLSGLGLSVSGVILQSITNNKLASPSIIGVNSGAGFAVILFMCFFPKMITALPFAAFLGAVVAALIILLVSEREPSGRKSSVILSGMAINAILGALISFISLINTDVLASYNYFSIGGLSGVSTNELIIPSVLIFLSFCVSMLLSRRIFLLCLGDTVASSLGVNIRRLRAVCIICACACAASVVSFAGLLGFIGLIVPNIARRLFGQNTTLLIASSAIIGAIIVLVADTLGRILLSPTEIPVGIIMALIGAPFFLILILRREKNA